MLLVKKHDGS
jgi:hypothetical protein